MVYFVNNLSFNTDIMSMFVLYSTELTFIMIHTGVRSSVFLAEESSFFLWDIITFSIWLILKKDILFSCVRPLLVESLVIVQRTHL